MISILVPFRNREIERVESLFSSISEQSSKEFGLFFIDYGSHPKLSKAVKELCSRYSFVEYIYCWNQFQPWNKAKALNSIIKKLDSTYCFIADVDFFFHPSFIEILNKLQGAKKNFYFQVGFLEPGEFASKEKFKDSSLRKSTQEATGLSLFRVDILKKLRGFDEFYHFWGAEDTDMHVRLRNSGHEVIFYDEQVLLLHQWHLSYRSKEKKELTQDLQVEGIVQLNHQHLKMADAMRRTVVNAKGWGNPLMERDLKELEQAPVTLELTNEKNQVEEFLFGILTNMDSGILKVNFSKNNLFRSGRYKVKKLLGEKVPEHYSLKEINDMVLLHFISFYRDFPYTFKINKDLNKIEVAINLTGK